MSKCRSTGFRSAILVALTVGAVAPLSAQGDPLAVSPGDPGHIATTADACPTFSWAGVPGAKGHELVVFELSDEPREAASLSVDSYDPILRTLVPGTATSWTPAGTECLEPGGRFGWVVRAVDGEVRGDWTRPRLFEVDALAGLGDMGVILETLLDRMMEDGTMDWADVEILRELVEASRPRGASAAPGTGSPSTPRSRDRGEGEARVDPEASFRPAVEEIARAVPWIVDDEMAVTGKALSGPDAALGDDLQLRSGGTRYFWLDSATGSGADLNLYDDEQLRTVEIDSETTSGSQLNLFAPDNDGIGSWSTVRLSSRGSGYASGSLELLAQPEAGGGFTKTFEVLGNEGAVGGDGSQLFMRRLDGFRTISFDAEFGAGGWPHLRMYAKDAGGTERLTVEIEAKENNDDNGAQIALYDLSGTRTITLDAEQGIGGPGQIATQVLQITGGSDLSEQFDVTGTDGIEPEPGMLVAIDREEPGRLTLTEEPYETAVVGVVSGAGGLRTGMLMGQEGSEATGELPVALVGRVYVRVDATHGAVRPGDLLTSSPTPGLAMRASDPSRTPGAVLGKAMSSLDEGEGLVLALISLQ